MQSTHSVPRRLIAAISTIAALIPALLAGLAPTEAAAASTRPSEARAAVSGGQLTRTEFLRNLSSYTVGPYRASGFGKMIPIRLKAVGKDVYRAVNRLENHDPRSLAANGGKVTQFAFATGGKPSDAYGKLLTRAQIRQQNAKFEAMDEADGVDPQQSAFCWPWEGLSLGNKACWNNPSTWNWGSMINFFAPKPLTKRGFDFIRQEKCARGALAGTFFAVVKPAGAALFGLGDEIKASPYGLIYSLVSGCIIKIFR